MTNLDAHLELNTLCQDLGEVEDQINSLTEERERLRARISELVEALGGRATLRGFGALQIAAPTVVASYDRKGLDQLVEDLISQIFIGFPADQPTRIGPGSSPLDQLELPGRRAFPRFGQRCRTQRRRHRMLARAGEQAIAERVHADEDRREGIDLGGNAGNENAHALPIA